MNIRSRPSADAARRGLRSFLVVGVLTMVGGGLVTPVASARPWPIDTPAADGHLRRPVERIGSTFVAGDNLTGAGVRAPSWVPIAR